MLNLFGCGKKQLNINDYLDAEKKTMLADYYERTVGLEEEQPYYELVMYTYSETEVLLEKYEDGGTDHETVTSYHVPADEAQGVFDAINNVDMASWNGKKGNICIDGIAYVCKFPDGKGDLIRVSSDDMPEDGAKSFYAVKASMLVLMKDEYLIED